MFICATGTHLLFQDRNHMGFLSQNQASGAAHHEEYCKDSAISENAAETKEGSGLWSAHLNTAPG